MTTLAHRILVISLLLFAALAVVSPLHAQDPLADVDTISLIAESTAFNAMLDQTSQENLTAHIDAMVSVGTRHVNSGYEDPDRGIGAAYDYILGEFQAISRTSNGNMAVWTDYFPLNTCGVESTGRNIVAVIGDTDLEGGTIIIGAHYDSVTDDHCDAKSPAPGANDNAAGVASLIELARILSQRPHRARIMLVAFSAEEHWTPDFRGSGSTAFVRDYVLSNHVAVKAMINLDMIGSSSGGDGLPHEHEIRLFSAGPDNSVSRQLANAIQQIAIEYVPPMQIMMQDSQTGDRDGRYGDHLSFSDAGYPAVRFIEVSEERAHQHNGHDTMDDVQPEYLTEVTRCILAIVTVIADDPTILASISSTA